MVKKPSIVDPGDGLIVSEVGPWASEKHARVQRYRRATAGQRANSIAATAMTTTAMNASVSMPDMRHMVRLYVDGPAAGFVPPAPPVVNDLV